MKITGSCHCGAIAFRCSGALRVQSFCSNCGSPLFVHGVDDASCIGLRTGCIDQPAELVPRRQIWCRSALAWTMDLSDLRRRERD